VVHDLSDDFFRFLDDLHAGAGPWAAYRKRYLGPHREVVTAVREQVVGIDEAAWRERVERVRPGDYDGLGALLAGADLEEIAAQSLARCREALDCQAVPDVYFVVGFFSPDAFLLKLRGGWQIAVGLERLSGLTRLPLLIAHEYGHWARRRLRPQEAETLGERMAAEGVSIVLTRRLYPQRPLADHLGVHRSRLNALAEAEAAGWQAVAPHLKESDPGVFQRFLSGVGPGGGLPPRIGVYLGYRAARALQRRGGTTLRELAETPAAAFFADEPTSNRV
jgi:uncharacterized protein YjaZ